MAKFLTNIMGFLLVSVVYLVTVSKAKIAKLHELNDKVNNNDCSMDIIENIVHRNLTLTLVNVHNEKFIERLHSLAFKVLTRTFLASKLHEPNEVYILQCDHFEECFNGFDDLIKDEYWNPGAIFIVTIRDSYIGQEELLKKLHHLYVFKTVLVINNLVYLYDFDVGEHCYFSSKAIKEYKCNILTSRSSDDTPSLGSPLDSPIWAGIKKSLVERPKIPYSGCNFTVIIIIYVPFIFPPLNESYTPDGFEEEFVNILKIINFTNLRFIYRWNLLGTGNVFDNFTASGVLEDIQQGRADYVLGASLLSHYRNAAFDFTYPHWLDTFLLIVPKARQVDKWIAMFTVFSSLVWGLIFVSFVCVTLVAFIFEMYGKRELKVLISTTLEMFGYLTNNSTKKSAGYFLLSWSLFAWLITCFYQSHLASIFTKPEYNKEVNSYDEIIKKEYKLYVSNAKHVFIKETEDLNMSGSLDGSVICKNDFASLEAVASNRRAYTLSSRLSYVYFDPVFHNPDGEPKLHRIFPPFFIVFRTGYVRKGNPNLKRIRFLERHIIAFGLHRRALLSYIHKNKLKYYKNYKHQTKPLACYDIAGVYYIYLCGCSISLLTYLLEIVKNK